MKVSEAPSKRPYRMQARAAAAAATGERILDAAVAVFWQRPVDDIPLEEVARRAGVSLQTVIRRFGGKQGLFAAAAQRETERVRRQRDRSPALRALADQGRAYHAAWCERVFAPALASLQGPERARRLAQLIAVTDVLTWKLLRRDRHLSRRQTELALIELLQPLTGGSRWPGSWPTPRPPAGTCSP